MEGDKKIFGILEYFVRKGNYKNTKLGRKRVMASAVALIVLCTQIGRVQAMESQDNLEIGASEAVEALEAVEETDFSGECIEEIGDAYVVDTDEQTVTMDAENAFLLNLIYQKEPILNLRKMNLKIMQKMAHFKLWIVKIK